MRHAMHRAMHHAMHRAMHRVRRNAHPVKAGYSEAKTESIDAQRAQLSRSLAASMKANLLGAGVRSHTPPYPPHQPPARARLALSSSNRIAPHAYVHASCMCTPRAGRRGAALRGQGAQGGPGGHQGGAAPPGGGRALSGLLGPLGPAPPSRGGVRTQWRERARARERANASARERARTRARESKIEWGRERGVQAQILCWLW